jgi:aconitase A
MARGTFGNIRLNNVSSLSRELLDQALSGWRRAAHFDAALKYQKENVNHHLAGKDYGQGSSATGLPRVRGSGVKAVIANH